MKADPVGLEVLRIEVGGRVIVHQAIEQVASYMTQGWLLWSWSPEVAEMARQEKTHDE